MTHPIEEILTIMRRLRDPETGCPWDCKQDFSSIAPYTIEEAYEVADAIMREDYDALRDELGDLLLQVVYHAQMAKEQELFEFDDVVRTICDKMISRHPHVFGSESRDGVNGGEHNWEKDKADERRAKGHTSVLDGIAHNLPALSLAHKIQSRAAYAGFDWRDVAGVFDKVEEELDEVKREADVQSPDRERVAEEIGDLLFTIVNLARHFHLDAETVLRQANHKFTKRFRQLEKQLKLSERDAQDITLEEMDEAWEEIKRQET